MVGVRRMKLGSQGMEVSAQELGCMSMTRHYYGPMKPEADMISLLHHTINTGVTFLNTSNVYGPFTNEILMGKTLKQGGVGLRDKVQLATKFGVEMEGGGTGKVRGDPAYVRECCEGSLERLQVGFIDLYYLHRIDTRICWI